MRHLLIVSMLLIPLAPAYAQVSIEIGAPAINIGVNVETYPTLVQVPGYPVYYDPQLSSNYFFYDGLYWVYTGDSWYASSWYNGPWQLYGPEVVPLFVLRVPVRYYREPPVYFRGWQGDASPRWGEHWGHEWETRRSGWDQWDRNSAPPPAPLPVYQREYTGARYPRAPEQQSSIRTENYRYQPHEAVARQTFQQAKPGTSPAAGHPQTPAPQPRADVHSQAPAAQPRADVHPQAPAAQPRTEAHPQAPAAQPKTEVHPQAAAPQPRAEVHSQTPAAQPKTAVHAQAPAAQPRTEVHPQAPAAQPKTEVHPQAAAPQPRPEAHPPAEIPQNRAEGHPQAP